MHTIFEILNNDLISADWFIHHPFQQKYHHLFIKKCVAVHIHKTLNAFDAIKHSYSVLFWDGLKMKIQECVNKYLHYNLKRTRNNWTEVECLQFVVLSVLLEYYQFETQSSKMPDTWEKLTDLKVVDKMVSSQFCRRSSFFCPWVTCFSCTSSTWQWAWRCFWPCPW